MPKFKEISNAPGEFMFDCPGCKCSHSIPTKGAGAWYFNGNTDRPTVSPSLLVRAPMWVPPVTAENHEEWKRNPWEQKQVESVCHSIINDGKIQYLSDCTHELAGQTVELPNLE